MHDIGLAHALEEQITQVMTEQGWSRVTRIDLQVGCLRNISADAIGLCMEEIFRETPSEGAKVAIQVLPARLNCRECGEESETSEDLPICPKCDGIDTQVLAGDEFVLESLQGD